MGSDTTSQVFLALADPTRRLIVESLGRHERLRVSDLTKLFDSSRQAVTKHLNYLCSAGIVGTEWRGRERIAYLEKTGCAPAQDWLDHYSRFWDDKLATLKSQIEREEKHKR